MRYCAYIFFALMLTGCFSTGSSSWWNPLSWFGGSQSSNVSYPPVTKGGQMEIHFAPDGSYDLKLQQPENPKDDAKITIDNVPTDKKGVTKTVTITLGGSEAGEFNKVGMDSLNIVTAAGAGVCLFGVVLIALYIWPVTRLAIMTWKLGAGVMGCGLCMIVGSVLLEKYSGYIGLLLLGVVWYYWDHRNALKSSKFTEN